MPLLVSKTQYSVGHNEYLTALHAHCNAAHHTPFPHHTERMEITSFSGKITRDTNCLHTPMTPSRSLHNLLHRQTVGLTPQPPTLLLCKPRRGLSGLGWTESSNTADHTGHSHKGSVDRWHIVTIPACMAACPLDKCLTHTHATPQMPLCSHAHIHLCSHAHIHACTYSHELMFTFTLMSPPHTTRTTHTHTTHSTHTAHTQHTHTHTQHTQHTQHKHTHTTHSTHTHNTQHTTHTQHTYPNTYYTLVTVRKMVALPPHVGKPT